MMLNMDHRSTPGCADCPGGRSRRGRSPGWRIGSSRRRTTSSSQRSATFDGAGGSAMAREALRLRPGPGPDGRLPDPRTRAGMADLYAYAHLLAERKRRAPGRDDVMSILLTEIDFAGGRVSPEEFREPVLALRRRRQ